MSEDLEAIKAKLPILELAEHLGFYFTRKNERYAYAKCLFHDDNNPSFVVDNLKRTAGCFACTDIGVMDHVRLIQQCLHLSREMAIDQLYKIAGEERPLDTDHDILRRVIDRIHINVTMNKPAAFFKDRGIGEQALNDFMVGYSPSFQWLKNEVLKDIPPDKAAALEFMRPELFDDTIVYPLFDGLGRVSGFKCRLFKQGGIKYIGNTGSFKFKPSRIYGIHRIGGKQRQIVLVEGPNDVLALRTVGIGNAGGLMGLNLNKVDEYLSDRGFSDIIILADGDEAGMNAMMKAPHLVRVNQIPGGKDPDEFAKSGKAAIDTLIAEAKYPIQIKFESRLAKLPTSQWGKITFIKELAKDLTDGLPPILLSILKNQVSEVTGLPEEDVASIFSLVPIDTERLERMTVHHLSTNGPLSEIIKMTVGLEMFANPLIRAQAKALYEGLSPNEQPPKVEGLTEGDINRFIEMHKRRHIRDVLDRISSATSNIAEPFDELLSRAVSKLSDSATSNIEVLNATDLLQLGLENIEERAKNPGVYDISFGPDFPKIDRTLQGLRRNSMYVLAATQGTGKSALAFDWALYIACESGIPILWVSLEMSRAEMADRCLAKLSGLSANSIQNGGLSDFDTKQIRRVALKYSRSPLHYVDCGAMNINQIVALVKKMKMTHGIRAVFLDYLQLIDGGQRSQSMYERVGYISRMIKSGITMDKSVGIAVVAIAQLARTAARVDTPTAEHIAESYKIAQDADVFMAIRRISEKESGEDQLRGNKFGSNCNMSLNIDKNRAGLSKVEVGLVFNYSNLRIKEAIQNGE